MTDHLRLNFFEIPKLGSLEEGHLRNWLSYFTVEGQDNENQIRILLEEEPILQKAHQIYREFTQDDELRAIYRAQEKAQRDIATRLEDAEQADIEKGKLERDLEIAKKMKAQGFDVQMIQKFTDLTFEEIDKF